MPFLETKVSIPVSAVTGRAILGTSPVAKPWRIYLITRRADGRRYVGVTCRTVRERFLAHRTDAMRRDGPHRRPGTIDLAIREAIQAGLSLDAAFGVRELACCDNPKNARRSEVVWIARLNAMQPYGFNYMPGGASLGSIPNAKPVALRHPWFGTLRFPTLSAAIAWRNVERTDQGQKLLKEGDVYWRIRDGWSVSEALGYREHEDGRGLRDDPVRCGTRTYRSFRAASRATGVPAAALRSRLHRARRAGLSDPDLAEVRGRGRVPRASRIPAVLPHPTDPDGPRLNSIGFARAAGLPKATVIHRLNRLRLAGGDPVAMPREDVLKALLTRTERRVVLQLVLSDGEVLRGGARELERAIRERPRLQVKRVEKLGLSAIKARLQRIPGWKARTSLDPAHVRWAFGFEPEAAPSCDTEAKGHAFPQDLGRTGGVA